MKLKRLKHTAFTVCHMFCGWRLMNSYHDLVKLRSGLFEYNLLCKKVLFEGKPIDAPAICLELDDFFKRELDAIGVNSSQLDKADLKVQIRFDTVDSKNRVTNDFHMDKKQNPISTGKFYRCHINAECKIEIQQREFLGQHNDVEEWPENWP